MRKELYHRFLLTAAAFVVTGLFVLFTHYDHPLNIFVVNRIFDVSAQNEEREIYRQKKEVVKLKNCNEEFKERNIGLGKRTTQAGRKMSNRVSKALDLCVESKHPKSYDSTCEVIDSTNGDTMIEAVNIPAWWTLELGAKYYVTSVEICTTRQQSEYRNLENFALKVDDEVCLYHPGAIVRARCKKIYCYLSGSFITIEKRSGKYPHKMTLCEIVVRGRPDTENRTMVDAIDLLNQYPQRTTIKEVIHVQKPLNYSGEEPQMISTDNSTSLNNSFSRGNCYLYNGKGQNASWYADMGEVYEVHSVTVCNTYLEDYYPLLGGFQVNVDGQKCTYNTLVVPKGECWDIPCHRYVKETIVRRKGRYVSIIKKKGVDVDKMVLCSTEIYTVKHIRTKNPPYLSTYPQIARKSKIIEVHSPMAYSGSADQHVVSRLPKPCYTTSATLGNIAWWYINLGKNYYVSYVSMCNTNHFKFVEYQRQLQVTVDDRKCEYRKDTIPMSMCLAVRCRHTGRHVTIAKTPGKGKNEDLDMLVLCDVQVHVLN